MTAVRNPTDAEFWDVQFGDQLADGETLTGTPTHESSDDLTFSNASVEDETGGKPSSVARVKVTGGLHGRRYHIKTTASTSGSRTLVKLWTYLVFAGV